jgi:hypothetical protein
VFHCRLSEEEFNFERNTAMKKVTEITALRSAQDDRTVGTDKTLQICLIIHCEVQRYCLLMTLCIQLSAMRLCFS